MNKLSLKTRKALSTILADLFGIKNSFSDQKAMQDFLTIIHEADIPPLQYDILRLRYGFDRNPQTLYTIAIKYRISVREIAMILAETLGTIAEYVKGEIEINPIFLEPIENLALLLRATNSLKRKGVWYIGELIQMTEEELPKIPHFFQKFVPATKQALAAHGLTLGTKFNEATLRVLRVKLSKLRASAK